MAIQKNSIITQTDVQALKAAVLNIYQKRPFLTNADLGNIKLDDFGNTPIQINNTINQNLYYALNALLQLNDIQNINVPNTTYDTIFKNGADPNEDLLVVVNNWENLGLKTEAKPISCRGGCVGLCWNQCDGECTYNCIAENFGKPSGSGSGAGQQYGYDCNGSCVGQCHGTCRTSNCVYTCETQCGSVCGNTCTNICKGGCKGGCDTGCTNTCVDAIASSATPN